METTNRKTVGSRLRDGWTLTSRVCRETFSRYQKLGWGGKSFVWFLILFHVGLITVFAVFGPSKIFQAMYDAGQKLKHMRFGWLLLGSIMIVTSIPPLIGYSTSLTICGFAFGPLWGFLVAATASMIGSTLAFLLLRVAFKQKIKEWAKKNKQWAAMGDVVATSGLPLVIMIRLCPIPWVYNNALFASVESVKLWQFVVATFCLLPKLWLVIFIGSQVALLSDGTTRSEMSTATKVMDILSILITVTIAIGVGAFVFRMTRKRIREMEGLPTTGVSYEEGEEAVNALDDASRPLLERVLSNEGDSYRDDE